MYIVYASIITVTNFRKKNVVSLFLYIHTVTYFLHYIDLGEIFEHGISNSGRLGQIFLRTTLLCLRS